MDRNERPSAIEQRFHRVSGDRRDDSLNRLLMARHNHATLVLCNMKQQCEVVARTLRNAGWYARALHGNLEARDREQVLLQFMNSSISIIVATDVAAGTFTPASLELVVSYDLPRNPDIHAQRLEYVQPGGALVYMVAPEEEQRFRRIVSRFNLESETESLPTPEQWVIPQPPYVTLLINGGSKDRLSEGELRNLLSSYEAIGSDGLGRVEVRNFCTYLAVRRDVSRQALEIFRNTRLHGKQYAVRPLDGRVAIEGAT